MLVHSFDGFYVITKFILPSIKDLKFSKLHYDSTFAYLQEKNGCTAEDKKYLLDLLAYCRKIIPYVAYYKQQIKSCNDTVHYILKNEIDLIFATTSYKTKMRYYHCIGFRLHGISL